MGREAAPPAISSAPAPGLADAGGTAGMFSIRAIGRRVGHGRAAGVPPVAAGREVQAAVAALGAGSGVGTESAVARCRKRLPEMDLE